MTVLAARAGLSQQMVSYVERGLRNPTLDTLLRISAALEIDLPDLLRTAIDRTKSLRFGERFSKASQ